MRILLIGLMGSGKSTIGRRLARETGWPYLDNDRLVEATTGRTAPDLIAEGGEAALHAAEVAAFERALAAPPPVIVGIAGSIVADAGARERLRDAGTVVWLRAGPETLRTRSGTGRGRRPDATSTDWIRAVAEERAPWFASVADVTVDVDRMRPREIVTRILSRPEVRAARAAQAGTGGPADDDDPA
jgi:shikimate kinase